MASSDGDGGSGETTKVREAVENGAIQSDSGKITGKIAYRCQLTELKRASSPLPWWDARQYVRDVRTGNTTIGKVFKAFVFSAYRKLVEIGIGYNLLISLYDWFQSLHGGQPYPYRAGSLQKTPTQELGLRPGEWVRVKSLEAITATLNTENRNRGLYFDAEMVRFCGRKFPVMATVTSILDEKTGTMLNFSNPCIILQDVYCRGELSKGRLFCPRAIYSYWREIWLERIEAPGE